MNPSKEHYRLRPMTAADLETVLEWRNSDRVRANMYHDHLISIEEHRYWFSRIQGSKEAAPYIFEYLGEPAGFVNFSGFDRKNNRCTWGFYLGRTDLPPGSGTMLGRLGIRTAFEELGIRKLCAEAFRFNEASIRFHLRLGFKQEGCLEKHVLKNGEYQDIMVFAMFADDYWKGKERPG